MQTLTASFQAECCDYIAWQWQYV